MEQRTLEKLYAILQEHFQKVPGATAPVTPRASASGMQGAESKPTESATSEESPVTQTPTPATPSPVPQATGKHFAGLSAAEIRRSLARYGMTAKDLPPEMQEQLQPGQQPKESAAVKKPPIPAPQAQTTPTVPKTGVFSRPPSTQVQRTSTPPTMLAPPMPKQPSSAPAPVGKPLNQSNRIKWNWPRGLPREKNYDRQMLKKMQLKFFRVPGQRWYKGISNIGSMRSAGGRSKGRSKASSIPGSTTMKEAGSGGGDFGEVVTVMKDLVKAMGELRDELKRGDKSKPASSGAKLTPALS